MMMAPTLVRLGALGAVVLVCVSLSMSAAAAREPCALETFGIAIDIGHTPGRPGATSARGVGEYVFNRTMARDLHQVLQDRGFTAAFLINESGDEIGLRERTATAARKNADVFLSIHHDSVQPHYLKSWTVDGQVRRYSDDFSGFSLFVSSKNARAEESSRLAETIGTELVAGGLSPTLHHAEPIAGENRELLDADRGIYRFDDLIVLKSATMPAVLLETGVIVHRDEEENLTQAAFRGVIAAAVADALSRVCGTLNTP